VLLCAIGRDANNQIYPVAWAVVEMETNDTWDWFTYLLCRDLQIGDGDAWVVISDQQKGILKAVQTWLPSAEHRNCARHIYANWRKKYKKKEYQKMFWKCAKASCITLFNIARAELAEKTAEGAQAIMNTSPHHWSRAWMKLGANCDSVDNNNCESFNKWIVEPRHFPIISLLESIRCKVMIRIQEMATKATRWQQVICPNILKKVKAMAKSSAYCHAISCGRDQYEVQHNDHKWTVDLEKKTCSCRYWQLSGLPCPHAISCIYYKTNTLDDYIVKCYHVEAFEKTYAHFLQPVEGMQNWHTSERPKPLPPKQLKMPGRPAKERKREPHEKPKSATRLSKKGSVIRCKKCKQVGHNRSTCDRRNKNNSSATSNMAAQSGQAPVSQANAMVITCFPSNIISFVIRWPVT